MILTIILNTDFYFAHPYSSWERSLNESTNGLVHQYLKKGSCFANEVLNQCFEEYRRLVYSLTC